MKGIEELYVVVADEFGEELKEKFEEEPMPEETMAEAMKVIKETLRTQEYEFVCALYGLDQEKKSVLEIAMEKSLNEDRVRMVQRSAVRKLRVTPTKYRLLYLLYDKQEIVETIMELQLKLRQATLAYEAMGGRVQGAHPIACEFDQRLCHRLARNGILTLEDIVEMGVRANRIRDLTVKDREDISRALTKNGLEDRVQVGMPFKEDQYFTVKETDGEVIIYFHPGDFSPTRSDLIRVMNPMFYAHKCIGADLDRLDGGEVRLFFNPMRNNGLSTYDPNSLAYQNRREVIYEVKKVIRACNPQVGKDVDFTEEA